MRMRNAKSSETLPSRSGGITRRRARRGSVIEYTNSAINSRGPRGCQDHAKIRTKSKTRQAIKTSQ